MENLILTALDIFKSVILLYVLHQVYKLKKEIKTLSLRKGKGYFPGHWNCRCNDGYQPKVEIEGSPPGADQDHSSITNEEAAELANEPNHHHFEIRDEVLYHIYLSKRCGGVRTVKSMPGYSDNMNFKFGATTNQV
ncbi:hypothetical protein [Pedobacter sp. WC2423]|uniref:hypothetical protein n=1 Tax=Pedobacter sp. WC2423 TaxID=3234142 RepID=UPI0034656AA1